MIYYRLFGIDANGQCYTFANETTDWTLRGVRRDSQCFGLCEMSAYDGEHIRLAVTYVWNTIDGYTFDPCGDIKKFYENA
jgi:hypothetical protein